jgi:hypothetical protein
MRHPVFLQVRQVRYVMPDQLCEPYPLHRAPACVGDYVGLDMRLLSPPQPRVKCSVSPCGLSAAYGPRMLQGTRSNGTPPVVIRRSTSGRKKANVLLYGPIPLASASVSSDSLGPHYDDGHRLHPIVLLSTTDPASAQHATLVAGSVIKVAAWVKWITLPDVEVSQGVAAWLAAGQPHPCAHGVCVQ